MNGRRSGLLTLTRRQRVALRRLLVAATAASSKAGGRAELERLARLAPIRSLPAAAALHRVAGSVLRGMAGVDGVPREVCAELATLRQAAALRHLLITAELGRAGRAFDEAGLSWVAIKGPVVAGLYPDAGDRRYGDLDLLVARRDFPQAVRILEDLGYAHSIHNWALAERMLVGQVGLRRNAVPVDLHWHLHFSRQDRLPLAFEPEAMIERATTVTVAGVTAPALDAVDTVITLAFHAARSDGHRLVWFKDVERVLAVEHPDLDELVRRSRAYRCAPAVGLILNRARNLLGAEIPRATIRALAPDALLAADRMVSALAHPIALHDGATITRAMTRSVRASVGATVAAIPRRSARRLHRALLPPPANETDNPTEKASYLDAVVASIH